MYTLLEFSLAQDVDFCQCFKVFGSEPPQTGQSFSVGLITRLALHLEHLTAWSLLRMILSGARLVTGFSLTPLEEVLMNYVIESLSAMSKNICEAHAHTMTY
jgi:hypothetical protein